MAEQRAEFYVRYRETEHGRWRYVGPFAERDDARLAMAAIRSWGWDRSVVGRPAGSVRPTHVRARPY
jgi:hypothetical protein